MKVALLADFGSTYTKVAAVNTSEASVAGLGESPTDADGDVLDSYEEAASAALRDAGAPTEVVLERAASSAGGGLKMVAVGLVPSLTAAAAQTAALNAGARLQKSFAGELGSDDEERIRTLAPEILLFAGGTDGGQEARVVSNAHVVAPAAGASHVVVACNEKIAEQVRATFEPVARSVTVVANVLPEIGRVNAGPAREAIAGLFVREVIAGKHLSGSRRFLEMVAMATPDAVLRASELGAEICDGRGTAGMVTVDVGGATTDVYSVLTRRAFAGLGVRRKGFVDPTCRRSVQGDLGIRSNAPSALESDRGWLSEELGPEWLEAACRMRQAAPAQVFDVGRDRTLDEALATSCMFRALERHCGRRSIELGVAERPELVEEGPDLRGCRVVVGSGGILRESYRGATLVSCSLGRLPEHVLAPRRSSVVIDRHCVLAAAGLLSNDRKDLARALLRRELLEDLDDGDD